ncbi:MAG TPA: hypothetical protein PLG59_04665 [bacterium]|nr:hypothetical protein [bacterium]HQO33930.1 hypothetical protein [bacterium]
MQCRNLSERTLAVYHCLRIFLQTLAILSLFCLSAFAVDSASPALGLEPGDLQLCNDDLGIILWGPDHAPTLSVGKSDIWDRRLPKESKPVMTLRRMIELAMDGDKSILNGTAYYTVYNSYDFPCPKPAGQIIFNLNFMKTDPGANEAGILRADHGKHDLQIHAIRGNKEIHLKIFVSSVRNLIVIEGSGTGLERGDMSVRLYRHRDTIVPGGERHPTLSGKISGTDFEQLPFPRVGAEKNVLWLAQDFAADLTFPDGFGSILAARVQGVQYTSEVRAEQTGLGTPLITEKEGRLSHGITKRYTPINEAAGSAVTANLEAIDGPFQIYATVTTTQNDPSPLDRAIRDLRSAVRSGTGKLRAQHEKQLESYAERPHVRAWSKDGRLKIDQAVGGNPYRLRLAGYYGDIPLCSVDTTKFCFQDSSRWHADFHFNEIEATSLCILRQFESMDPYLNMIATMLPMAQANAREVYECAGAMYPLVHYPLKAETVIHTHLTWEQSMEITALLFKPFWLRFLYTWDLDYLRNLAYPVMREGARFYTDFLKKSDDGLYHVYPTVSPEHRGITEGLKYNRDSQSGITLIRYLLRATAKASELLDCDREEAERWREIAEHLPPYPTVDTPEGPIFIDVAGAQPMEYNIAVPLSAVFWGDDIGLDSPPEQVELAKRTLRLINVWEPHRGYLIGVRARLGIYREEDGISVQHVLQSHTGVIRVFPAVPNDFEGGFENLGAQGGFIISSERTPSGVRFVQIESLAENDCAVANPWPAKSVRVTDETDNRSSLLNEDKGVLHFQSAKNHVYRLTAE